MTNDHVPCILCGGREARRLFSVTDRFGLDPRSFSVFKCVRCGTLQLDPFPLPEEIPGLYPESYNYKLRSDERGLAAFARQLEWSLFYRPVYERTYRMVRRALGRGGFSVLDVGCGSGLRLRVFADHGCAVTGNDTSAACAEYVRNELKIPVVQGRLEDVPTDDDGYDAVTLFALVEHLPAPGETLRRAARLVKKGGVIALQVPAAENLQFSLLGRRAAMIREMPRHLFIPSVAQIAAVMKEMGFVLVERKPLTVRELASLFSLGLFPGSSAADAYAGSGIISLVRRLAGWTLALAAGIPVALIEKWRGVGMENILIFRNEGKQ